MRIVKDEFEEYTERPGEVRPTNQAPVITSGKGGISFENLKWGFKKWSGAGVIINARSETIKTTGMFKTLLNAGRCVVPAADFYEWQRLEKGKRKHYAKDKDGNLLFFAGLYRDTDEGREFVIITKEATGEVAAIHDRMPVILRVNQIEPWLNGDISPDDLKTLEYDLSVRPCDDDESDENQQMSLFDD